MADNNERKVSISDRITNDFLVYVAYALVATIVLMFIYNSSCSFKYGNVIGLAMPKVIWALIAIFAVATIVFYIIWNKNGRRSFRICANYLLATTLGLLWGIGAQEVGAVLKNYIPLAEKLMNMERNFRMLFYVLGISSIVMVIIYIVRIQLAKQGKGLAAKKPLK